MLVTVLSLEQAMILLGPFILTKQQKQKQNKQNIIKRVCQDNQVLGYNGGFFCKIKTERITQFINLLINCNGCRFVFIIVHSRCFVCLTHYLTAILHYSPYYLLTTIQHFCQNSYYPTSFKFSNCISLCEQVRYSDAYCYCATSCSLVMTFLTCCKTIACFS